MQTAKARLPVIAAAIISMIAATPANAAVPADKDPIRKPDATETQVVIRNYNSLDVQIVAVTEAGKRYRLGTVNRSSERTFDVPDCLIDSGVEFRLKIYSLARAVPASVVDNHVAGVKTQPLTMTEGEEIRLVVKSPLATSFIERG
jgi:hypothetical protein